MTEHTFRLNGLSCTACEKVVERVVSAFPGAQLKGIDAATGTVTVECEEALLKEIKGALVARGYGIEGETTQGSARQSMEEEAGPGSLVRVKKVLHGVLKGESAFAIERMLIEYAQVSLIVILIADIAGYGLFLKTIPDFWRTFGPLVFLVSASTVACATAILHFRSFRTDFSCMSGMMIGMSIGMISGFLGGALIGATNGMFIGSIAGMAIGMGLGGWAGRCCGIMGVMEGLMAGMMSGTMGAMLSVMMVNDHLILFLYILFGACVTVLAGLSYMMYKEAGNIKQEDFRVSFIFFLSMVFAVNAALLCIIFYGPKSGIVWGG
ncbi:MAG: heavy metal-associated domain-containing protein [Candidatus Bilamarchaeaceae archaeon]